MRPFIVSVLAALVAAFVSTQAVRAEPTDGAKVVTWHNYDAAIELTNPNIRVVLCPQVGGRVLEYALHGKNVLFVSQEEKDWKRGNKPPSSAGRFDIGPELIIPPHRILWSGEWTGSITGPRTARLVSQPDPETGVRLERTFELDEASSRLRCTQTIVNVSTRVTEWCHWSRTFAVGHGICLIPVTAPSRFPGHYVMYEEGTLINMKPEDPAIRTRNGMIEILGPPRRPKLGFDSSAGILAYVAPNNLLFLKRFEVDRNRVYNEAAGLTASVWYPDGDMVELEPIGPRETLAPGQSASFTEEWWLDAITFPTSPDQLDLTRLQDQLSKLK